MLTGVTPYVLREAKQDCKLIGVAYVDGVMPEQEIWENTLAFRRDDLQNQVSLFATSPLVKAVKNVSSVGEVDVGTRWSVHHIRISDCGTHTDDLVLGTAIKSGTMYLLASI